LNKINLSKPINNIIKSKALITAA